MELGELRYGNWVDSKMTGTICQIKEIHEDIALENIEGIVLTEWWLKKFGFKDIRSLDNTDIKEYRQFDNYSFCVQFPCGSETHCYAGNYPVAIKHVHQLQNLYFSLTNEELTIK